MTPARKWGSGGLAAVWAPENTREALFDAMQRRETFATSGPRITVSLFGGWGFPDGADEAPDVLAVGRSYGVPMGGDLPVAPEVGLAPEFIAVAQRDPLGANLDRIQMIKGWVDAEGVSHEAIFDLAWSGDRDIDPETGKLLAVGSTVDPKTATYTNDIGVSQLKAQWRQQSHISL